MLKPKLQAVPDTATLPEDQVEQTTTGDAQQEASAPPAPEPEPLDLTVKIKAPKPPRIKVDWTGVYHTADRAAQLTAAVIGITVMAVVSMPFYFIARIARACYNAGKAGWKAQPV